MSLDVMHCRIVTEAYNRTYDVGDYAHLKNIQVSGQICVYEERIGRACLSTAWHDTFEHSPEDVYKRMMVVLPSELNEKLLRWLRLPNPESDKAAYAWFHQTRLQKPWDFIFITG